MTDRLDGQVAVVTGAAGGIGSATALALAERGAMVALVDVDGDRGKQALQGVEEVGGKALLVRADVGDADDVADMAREILGAFGQVDFLINNAAIFPRSLLLDMAPGEWSRVLRVNLTGPFLCTKAFLPSMVKRRSGRIVNVGSGLGVTGGVRAAHYSSSKGGLIALTKCLARELAPHGITANVLVPGLTDTEMPRRGQSDDEVQAMVEQIPLGRLAAPQEVAEVLAFLVGPSCSYITGQTIFVNGGWVMP